METIAQDTIVAITTPIGDGAIAMVRISGPDTRSIIGRIFVRVRRPQGELKPNQVIYGRIVDEGDVIDEVMLTFFSGPKSYTREDVAEISCHGSLTVARRILTVTLQNGARMADPGEFTKRAFLNGRIDLTQAEAVAELIASNSDTARRASIRQLGGSLSSLIDPLRHDLISCLSEIEASIDFPEEGISTESIGAIERRLIAITVSLDSAIVAAESSSILRIGLSVPIVGLPNVGKSSLLNALLNKQRAIVSPVPGTTRDTIEELVNLNGIPIRFIDTAGIRETGDQVEMQGVERTRAACDEADVIVVVTEAHRSLTDQEREMLCRYSQQKIILVLNKSDLAGEPMVPNVDSRIRFCNTSALESKGLNELHHILKEVIQEKSDFSEKTEFLINDRHKNALCRAKTFLTEALKSIGQGMPIESTASDIRLACNALSEIIGLISSEDILNEVFSKFCIGK